MAHFEQLPQTLKKEMKLITDEFGKKIYEKHLICTDAQKQHQILIKLKDLLYHFQSNIHVYYNLDSYGMIQQDIDKENQSPNTPQSLKNNLKKSPEINNETFQIIYRSIVQPDFLSNVKNQQLSPQLRKLLQKHIIPSKKIISQQHDDSLQQIAHQQKKTQLRRKQQNINYHELAFENIQSFNEKSCGRGRESDIKSDLEREIKQEQLEANYIQKTIQKIAKTIGGNEQDKELQDFKQNLAFDISMLLQHQQICKKQPKQKIFESLTQKQKRKLNYQHKYRTTKLQNSEFQYKQQINLIDPSIQFNKDFFKNLTS